MNEADPRAGITFDIAPSKLTHYLLDLSNKDGRGKAKFFLAAGFTPKTLDSALLEHVASASLDRV